MPIKIIAEIGINHNGDLKIAKGLIDCAKLAGCDYVKFQKRTIDKVYSQELLNSPRESPWGKTQREQKEGLEFGKEDYKEIDVYCREKEIKWFASAWDLDSLLFLDKFALPCNKIASAMMVDKQFVTEIAERQMQTYISTGMCDEKMISNVVEIFIQKNCPFELMHCVSTYPLKDSEANLNAILTLKEKFCCDVGYSGHESGLAISYAAAALGITSLERHITLDRAMYGSDQAASIEPIGLINLVGAIRKIQNAMGDGTIRITESEKQVAIKLREHIKG